MNTFTLVDEVRGEDLAWVQPGETLDFSAYRGRKLAIRANLDAAQGRVKLQLGDGQPVERDRIPYSISIPKDWTGGACQATLIGDEKSAETVLCNLRKFSFSR